MSSLRDFLLRADDDRPHLRGGVEGELRRTIVMTGRLELVLFMAYFARLSEQSRRAALASIFPLALVHGAALRRLYALYRDEGRDAPPITQAGVAHGVMGYACLATLAANELRGPVRLAPAAEWYPYVGLGVVDVVDGALRRRRRPLRDYAALSAVTAAAGLARASRT
jgi:hypothetical protein